MYDSTQGGAWTGDIGYHCDQKWYHRSEKAWSLPNGGGDYIPRCTWLDEDHTDDVASAAIKSKTTAHAEKVQDTLKNDEACKFAVWVLIMLLSAVRTIFLPKKHVLREYRRALKPRPAWMEDSLVVSNVTQQSTEELFSSTSSCGPDFVGPDGLHCDMETKTLAPVCSQQEVDGCVKVSHDGKTLTKRKSVAKRVVHAAHKSYGSVTHWK